MNCNYITLPLKLKRLANICFIILKNLTQYHRIKQKFLQGNAVPFSRLTSGTVLCFYDNCSCGLFRSMLTPPISRLYDYGIHIHLLNQQQEAINFEPILCFFQCLVKFWTLFFVWCSDLSYWRPGLVFISQRVAGGLQSPQPQCPEHPEGSVTFQGAIAVFWGSFALPLLQKGMPLNALCKIFWHILLQNSLQK